MATPPGAIDESLRRAVQHCASMLGCSDAMLYSWDSTRDRLVARASTDTQRTYEKAIELSLGEGVVGWSALNREVARIDDFPTDDLRFRVVPGIDEVNHRSFLAVPLLLQGSGPDSMAEVQGVLVARHRDPGQFTLERIQSIEAVGLLLASMLREEADTGDDRLVEALRRIADIGSAESLAPSEVPTLIAHELAQTSGAELVAIVAPSLTDRPYLDILGVGVNHTSAPNPLRQQSVRADAVGAAVAADGPLRRDDAAQLFEPFGAWSSTFATVTAHPLEARGARLGTVLAYQSESISGRDRTSERLVCLIRQASVSLALVELTTQPAGGIAERRLIDLLLSGQDRPALIQQLQRETGFDQSAPHCVIVGQAAEATDPGIVHQQLQLIERAIRREHPDSLCGVRADSVRAVVGLAGRTPAEVAIGLDTRLRLLDLGHAGVSDPVVTGDYRRSLNEATAAVHVSIRVPGMAAAVAVSETGAYRSLLTLIDHQQPSTLERRLGQLRLDDKSLFDTVAAFVDYGCRPSPTARALHLHRNSLAGRLKSASAALRLPINESNRLELELAIRLVKLRP